MSIKLEKTEYSIMDELDEKQITGFSEELKKKMAYKHGDKMELTFIGLKAITLKMSQKDQPLETIMSEIRLDKDAPDDKKTWFWRAAVKVRNQKTGLETEGISESPYFDGDSYDQFGRTKAHSKAERNAWRKQIPELEIVTFLETLEKDQVEEVQGQKGVIIGSCKCKNDYRIKDGKCVECGGTKLK